MKLITKPPFIYEYDCKYIEFSHEEIKHEDEVKITLLNGVIEWEKFENIDYIKY